MLAKSYSMSAIQTVTNDKRTEPQEVDVLMSDANSVIAPVV